MTNRILFLCGNNFLHHVFFTELSQSFTLKSIKFNKNQSRPMLAQLVIIYSHCCKVWKRSYPITAYHTKLFARGCAKNLPAVSGILQAFLLVSSFPLFLIKIFNRLSKLTIKMLNFNQLSFFSFHLQNFVLFYDHDRSSCWYSQERK